MKKIISAIIIASTALTMTACTGKNETVYYAPGPKLKICATTSPIYSITADVISTRQNIALEQITKAGEDPSEYTLTPEETNYFSKFNACIISGMGYDDEIAEQLKKANPNIKICISSEGINPISLPDGNQNPYVWTSPVSQASMCKNIIKFMVKIDTINESGDKKGSEAASYGTVDAEYCHRYQFILNRLAGESTTVSQNLTKVEDKQRTNKAQEDKKASKNNSTTQDETDRIEKEGIEKIKKFIACNPSKTYKGNNKYDYLLRDCGLSRDEQNTSSIEIQEDNSSNNDATCKLHDIMKEKEIMPDTCGHINLLNASEVKRIFGEIK